MGTARQEPWAFGEPWESVCRAMLELRMQLLPYLYTAFEECHRTGAPVLRPLLFSYPDDPVTYTADDEFMVGRRAARRADHAAGCRAPARVPARGLVGALVDERPALKDPHMCWRTRRLGQPAVYARCDTPIPLWPVLQHTDEVPDSLTWRVFAGARLWLWVAVRGLR